MSNKPLFPKANYLNLNSQNKGMGKRVEQYSYLFSLWTLLLQTLKGIRIWIVLVILLDFLFYAGAFGIMSLAAKEIKGSYDALTFPDPSIAQEITEAEAASMLAQMKSFRNMAVGVLGMVAIAIIAWWSVCKGIIWSITLKEKIQAATLWKFFMLNLAWLGCWMLLISGLAYAIDLSQAAYFFLAVLGLFALLTASIYTFFIPSPSFASFRKGLSTSFKKFHLLLLPATFLFLAYVLIAKLFMLSAHIAMQIGLLLFTLCYVAVARSYLAAVLQSIAPHNEERLKD